MQTEQSIILFLRYWICLVWRCRKPSALTAANALRTTHTLWRNEIMHTSSIRCNSSYKRTPSPKSNIAPKWTTYRRSLKISSCWSMDSLRIMPTLTMTTSMKRIVRSIYALKTANWNVPTLSFISFLTQSMCWNASRKPSQIWINRSHRQKTLSIKPTATWP